MQSLQNGLFQQKPVLNRAYGSLKRWFTGSLLQSGETDGLNNTITDLFASPLIQNIIAETLSNPNTPASLSGQQRGGYTADCIATNLLNYVKVKRAQTQQLIAEADALKEMLLIELNKVGLKKPAEADVDTITFVEQSLLFVRGLQAKPAIRPVLAPDDNPIDDLEDDFEIMEPSPVAPAPVDAIEATQTEAIVACKQYFATLPEIACRRLKNAFHCINQVKALHQQLLVLNNKVTLQSIKTYDWLTTALQQPHAYLVCEKQSLLAQALALEAQASAKAVLFSQAELLQAKHQISQQMQRFFALFERHQAFTHPLLLAIETMTALQLKQHGETVDPDPYCQANREALQAEFAFIIANRQGGNENTEKIDKLHEKALKGSGVQQVFRLQFIKQVYGDSDSTEAIAALLAELSKPVLVEQVFTSLCVLLDVPHLQYWLLQRTSGIQKCFTDAFISLQKERDCSETLDEIEQHCQQLVHLASVDLAAIFAPSDVQKAPDRNFLEDTTGDITLLKQFYAPGQFTHQILRSLATKKTGFWYIQAGQSQGFMANNHAEDNQNSNGEVSFAPIGPSDLLDQTALGGAHTRFARYQNVDMNLVQHEHATFKRQAEQLRAKAAVILPNAIWLLENAMHYSLNRAPYFFGINHAWATQQIVEFQLFIKKLSAATLQQHPEYTLASRLILLYQSNNECHQMHRIIKMMIENKGDITQAGQRQLIKQIQVFYQKFKLLADDCQACERFVKDNTDNFSDGKAAKTLAKTLRQGTAAIRESQKIFENCNYHFLDACKPLSSPALGMI